MMHLLVLLCCLAGFLSLALATERQQEALFGRILSGGRSHGLRWTGWGFLAVALWIVVAAQGWGLGLVSYSGHTSLAAGLVYLGLIVRARLG
ncbi:DUF3325 domain-containing protein [Bordetella bronchialis]|uniref:DUF3325 domain-containing protein n=1 Tax=Bordetella bronchialis TaxID=463025 RepID=A0A193FU96_9BORD|nr:DUF3325 domain-containing protein [Bordetella bronchialis]ANN65592.1 hypothetical protein BAU06_04135 [Bordetella bronchialis]ANN70619.1 hypothetical protein BAU08_04095 [Bordetella bronchialis]